MNRKYSTRDEAIFREIIEPIEHGDVDDARAEFDIAEIAEKVLGDFDEGYACKVTVDEFWKIVEENAR